MCTERSVRVGIHVQAFLLMCVHISVSIHVQTCWQHSCAQTLVVSVGACTNCRVCMGLCGWVCTWIWGQMYAHARYESTCPCSREVGVVPGQELQVHGARTQAAGACVGHVCAQLRVLAAGGLDSPCAFCSRRARRFVPPPRAAAWAPGSTAWASRPRRDWRPGGRLGSLPGGRSRIPLPAQRGRGGGGGRQAIHLLLLQRNGAARAPTHLSSASFADNGHLSSLSSAPMSSVPLTGRGGVAVAGRSTGVYTCTWACWTHAPAHTHRHTEPEGAHRT